MSVVIVGGNERMVCQYEDICKCFGCKAKSIREGKRRHEKEDRRSGSSYFVYKHGFPQNGKLRRGRGEEEIHSCVQMSFQQCVRPAERSSGVLRVIK